MRRQHPLHRRFIAIGALGLIACGPLLGLDDLRGRVVDGSGVDAAEEATTNDGGADSTCTTNKQCIDEALGAPALCVTVAGAARRCVQVNKDICYPQVLPDNKTLESDNVVLVAAFIPIGGGLQLSSPNALAYSLALTELKNAGGIPTTPPRDVAMLFCASNPTLVEESVKHVIDDLRVPAIIANFTPEDLTRLVPKYAVPAGVFALNTNVASETLKYTSTDQLTWNLLGTPQDIALAYRPLLLRVEKHAKTNVVPPHPSTLKVALVTTDSVLESSIATVIEKGRYIGSGANAGQYDGEYAIQINGLSPAANGSNFVAVKPIHAIEKGGSKDFTETRAALKQLAPDVVILLTAEEASGIFSVESDIVADGHPPPIWILGPRNAQQGFAYLKAKGFNVEHKRFFGVQYAGAVDTAEKDAWIARMRSKYGVDASAPAESSENFYDAVYWLAYGFGAAGPNGTPPAGSPLTGEVFRIGVRNLTTGSEKIFPGEPERIGQAFALARQQKTKFVGALGPPDIDETYGIWNSVGGVYCFTVDGTLKYDTLRYDKTDGGLITNDKVEPCVNTF